MTADHAQDRRGERPPNLEAEQENLRPKAGGGPPRPATEPKGAGGSTQTDKTATDPGSGLAKR